MPAPVRLASAPPPSVPALSTTALRPMWRFAAADVPRILIHLCSLDHDDRLLRFGHGMRDEGIAAYVAGLDFAGDHVHGLCAANGDIVALAHVAMRDDEVDFGLSVSADHRQRGLGRALFSHVIALARLHDACRVVCHSVSPAALHMATASGFRRHGGRLSAPLVLELKGGNAGAEFARGKAAELHPSEK